MLVVYKVKQTYPNGRLVNYTRDQQGRIVAITTQAGVGFPLQEVVSGVSYQPYGSLTGPDYGNGLTLAIDVVKTLGYFLTAV